MKSQSLLTGSPSHKVVYDLISGITPFDALEQDHIQTALDWVRSGSPLYRIAKPDIPDKHLVVYFVLYDEEASKILLVDHKNAQLWLPTGGHVDGNEHPKDAAIRECFEELQINADFWQDTPLFLTSTVTVGHTAGHTDVSLWYVLRGNHKQVYHFDPDEFNAIRWFSIQEMTSERTEPHMHRFVRKLRTFSSGHMTKKEVF